jgi:hypothetical protein
MTHLREWLRRLIDEPDDISLDSLVKRQRAGATGRQVASEAPRRYRSLSTLSTYTRRGPAEANHVSQA